jgi:TatD-related deoxyribonuclease
VALPPDLPVVDHHAHLSPAGEGVAAAQRFRDAGGTHLFLATQNYSGKTPLTLGDYIEQFETTFRLADEVHTRTGVVVYSVIAPYPIDLIAGSASIGIPAAIEVQTKAIDLAGKSVRDGDAVALGEVGRPHFAVSAEVADALDQVFRHALEVAHDLGCPVVVHSSDLDAAGFAELAATARELDVPAHRVVKHYARTRVEDRAGVTPSYLARRELVKEVRHDPGPWFLETDFLDDPKRPGAVLDLATVPRRAQALAEEGAAAVEMLRTPFVESVKQVYGFRPVWPDTDDA